MDNDNQMLIECVKSCAQELIDHAEELIGNGKHRTDLTIEIRILMGSEFCMPEIEVRSESRVGCANAIRALSGGRKD